MDCEGCGRYIYLNCKEVIIVLQSPKFPPDKQPAKEEEDYDPCRGHEEPPPDGVGVAQPPAPEHDLPHGLHWLGVRQQPDEGNHPGLGHSLQRPDDPAEQHVGEARADGELHRVHARVADGREKESEAHSRQAWL